MSHISPSSHSPPLPHNESDTTSPQYKIATKQYYRTQLPSIAEKTGKQAKHVSTSSQTSKSASRKLNPKVIKSTPSVHDKQIVLDHPPLQPRIASRRRKIEETSANDNSPEFVNFTSPQQQADRAPRDLKTMPIQKLDPKRTTSEITHFFEAMQALNPQSIGLQKQKSQPTSEQESLDTSPIYITEDFIPETTRPRSRGTLSTQQFHTMKAGLHQYTDSIRNIRHSISRQPEDLQHSRKNTSQVDPHIRNLLRSLAARHQDHLAKISNRVPPQNADKKTEDVSKKASPKFIYIAPQQSVHRDTIHNIYSDEQLLDLRMRHRGGTLFPVFENQVVIAKSQEASKFEDVGLPCVLIPEEHAQEFEHSMQAMDNEIEEFIIVFTSYLKTPAMEEKTSRESEKHPSYISYASHDLLFHATPISELHKRAQTETVEDSATQDQEQWLKKFVESQVNYQATEAKNKLRADHKKEKAIHAIEDQQALKSQIKQREIDQKNLQKRTQRTTNEERND